MHRAGSALAASALLGALASRAGADPDARPPARLPAIEVTAPSPGAAAPWKARSVSSF